jgi:hypothetical protein
VVRPPNGGRAHWRGAQDDASGMLLPLALGRSSADELGRLLAAAWKRERRNRVNARVSARASVRFCSAGFLARPLDENGWLTITGPSRGPGGKRLSRPRPRLRPRARDALSASGPVSASGRMAAWSVGRAERERADVPIFASGRMAAWCAERRMRERAVGCFHIRAKF